LFLFLEPSNFNNSDNNKILNFPPSNNLNITPNNILTQNLYLQNSQNQEKLNLINLTNFNFPQILPNLNANNFQNQLNNFNLLNPNLPNQNENNQDLNFQNLLKDNNNLIQNLANFINLKKQINQNQLHLNQNQIYFNQNHLYLNNQSNIPNSDKIFNSNLNNQLISNNTNKINMLNNISNILNQNNINNLNLNKANFNSAYRIEKDKDDIQFNFLNENGRKIIIKSEVKYIFIKQLIKYHIHLIGISLCDIILFFF